MKFDFKDKLNVFLGQIMNTKYIAIIFIIGIALVALPKSEAPKKKETENVIVDSYKERTETELEEIISKIKGAGRVSVMVMLSDSGNIFYAVNESVSTEEDQDAKHKSTEKSYVLKNGGSNTEEPLITKQITPEISGVLICASGAKIPEVKNNIINAASALLGIKSHRIEVLERE